MAEILNTTTMTFTTNGQKIDPFPSLTAQRRTAPHSYGGPKCVGGYKNHSAKIDNRNEDWILKRFIMNISSSVANPSAKLIPKQAAIDGSLSAAGVLMVPVGLAGERRVTSGNSAALRRASAEAVFKSEVARCWRDRCAIGCYEFLARRVHGGGRAIEPGYKPGKAFSFARVQVAGRARVALLSGSICITFSPYPQIINCAKNSDVTPVAREGGKNFELYVFGRSCQIGPDREKPGGITMRQPHGAGAFTLLAGELRVRSPGPEPGRNQFSVAVR
jgi:hypothetical protein